MARWSGCRVSWELQTSIAMRWLSLSDRLQMLFGLKFGERLLGTKSALLLAVLGLQTIPDAWQACPTVLLNFLQMLFKSGERLLGTERALLLAVLGLIPAVAPWALDFLQLWRSRQVVLFCGLWRA